VVDARYDSTWKNIRKSMKLVDMVASEIFSGLHLILMKYNLPSLLLTGPMQCLVASQCESKRDLGEAPRIKRDGVAAECGKTLHHHKGKPEFVGLSSLADTQLVTI